MARPRKPTQLKAIQGTLKAERINHREPQPEKREAIAPGWLNEEGKTAFIELSKIVRDMDVLTSADNSSLSMVCDAFSDYLEAGRVVDRIGITYTATNRDGEELIKANPAVSMKADAWRRVMIGFSKFGLDPSGRASLKTVKEEKPANSLVEFLGRGH